MMKLSLVAFVCLMALAASAAKQPQFAGTWEFDPAKSKNVGMMTSAKMTQTIQQTNSSLDVSTRSSFQGTDQEMNTHYDLTGKPANNDSPMAGPSETVSKWNADTLVTTWTSQSAVAGSEKVVRTETRSLSPDGNTMTIESVRGTNAPVVMVFEKQR